MTFRWLSVGFVVLMGGSLVVGGPVLCILIPDWLATLLGAGLVAAGVTLRPLKPV